MNWTLLILVGVILIALIIFLVKRNLKDEKSLKKKLNEDYPKSRDEEGDADIEDTKTV